MAYGVLAPPSVALAPANPNSGSILGTDVSCFPDLFFVPVTGFLNISNAIVRRWMTPRGGLFYDPDYGTDLRDWVNSSSTSSTLYQLASIAEAEAEKDPRVTSCTCSVTYDPNGPGFDLSATIVTSAGPFVLVAAVTLIGVELLTVSPT